MDVPQFLLPGDKGWFYTRELGGWHWKYYCTVVGTHDGITVRVDGPPVGPGVGPANEHRWLKGEQKIERVQFCEMW